MSLSPVQAEIKAMVTLLEQDWPSPEDLAKELILALDKARGDRTTYTVVMQFGPGEDSPTVFYHGFGPFPGAKSAVKAVKRFPGASMASKIAVVPVTNEEWLDTMVKQVNKPNKKEK